jgi:dTDP-4-dehydrorhamnose 3,5-epimerase
VTFQAARLEGVFLIRPERLLDERGFFARTFCKAEFMERNMVSEFTQCSLSFNRTVGTLRGLHFQMFPYEETKLVRCTMGSIFDVVLDLRPNSLTHGQWDSFELSAENRRIVYIPAGCAHGFQTLQNDTEVLYQIDKEYSPDHAAGVRWNDPAFNIEWPVSTPVVSKRDQEFPLRQL